MNALHHAMCAGNLKVPISFNGNASNICTHPFPSGDDCLNHIPRLESKDFAWPFRAAPWKSPSVNITKLAALSASGCDKQGDNMLPLDPLWCRWPHAYSVEPMTLGNAALFPIPFCLAPRTDLDRQSCGFESFIERPTCRVHCCCVFQWLQGLCLEVGKAKCLGGLGAFLLIARFAGQGEIGDPVTASTSFGHDMFHFERDISFLAVDAFMSPFE